MISRATFASVLWWRLASPAAAQDHPSRPIRLVAPYPAGGPVDIMGRIAGQKLTEQPGVQTVVDNRAGANGNIDETVRGYKVLTWYGVFVATATPAPIVKRLHAAIVAGIGSRDTQERMTALGVEAATNSPGAFAVMVREEITKWGQVLRSAGVRPE